MSHQDLKSTSPAPQTATCTKCFHTYPFDPCNGIELSICKCGGQEYTMKPANITTVKITINHQRLQDLLCTAMEGGSNYWYQICHRTYPDGETLTSLKAKGMEYPHIELPFYGGSLTLKADDDPKEYILDLAAIYKGIQIMADKYPRHFGDFIDDNDDATTGDVFLQCCLFGELIYG